MNKDSHTIQFNSLVHETEKAFLLDIDGFEVWLPKSQCEVVDTTYTLVEVPDWLVDKNSIHHMCIDECVD